jgi:hypothetical protein
MKLISLLLVFFLFTACNSNKSINSKEKTTEKAGFQIHNFSKTFRGFFTNNKFEKEKGSLALVLKDSILFGDFVFDADCKGVTLKGKLLPNNKFEFSDGEFLFEGEFKDSMHFNGQCAEKKLKQFKFEFEQKTISLFHLETSQSVVQNSEHLVDGKSSVLTTTITTVVNSPAILEQKINKTLLTAALKLRLDSNFVIPKTNKKILAKIQDNLKLEEGDGFEQEINVSYSTRFDEIASFSVGGNFYAFGTPHPSASLEFFNFNLSNGELIHLSDLLNKGTKGKLNKIAEKILYKEYGRDMWDFEEGEFELNDNFEISDKGLTFLFNQYEIGPYAIGMPEIFIPFSKMKSLIKEDGVLKQFFK